MADYQDLQLDHTRVNVEIEDVCYQAHFLADRMLKYDWEDSEWQYQKDVAQQIDNLRQKLDSVLDWPAKREYLVGITFGNQRASVQPSLKQAHAALSMG